MLAGTSEQPGGMLPAAEFKPGGPGDLGQLLAGLHLGDQGRKTKDASPGAWFSEFLHLDFWDSSRQGSCEQGGMMQSRREMMEHSQKTLKGSKRH